MNEKPFPAWQEPNSLVASAEFSWGTPQSTPARLTSCPSPPRAAPSLRNPLSKVMTLLGEQRGKDVGGEQAKLLQEKEGRHGRELGLPCPPGGSQEGASGRKGCDTSTFCTWWRCAWPRQS